MFKNVVAAIDGAKFRPSIPGTATSHAASSSAAWSRSLRASADTSKPSMRPTFRGPGAEEKVARLPDKIAAMRTRLAELKEIEKRVHEARDQQFSLTNSDSRAMATNMRDASVVGYNVQAAVDTEHHLIVPREVTNMTSSRRSR